MWLKRMIVSGLLTGAGLFAAQTTAPDPASSPSAAAPKAPATRLLDADGRPLDAKTKRDWAAMEAKLDAKTRGASTRGVRPAGVSRPTTPTKAPTAVSTTTRPAAPPRTVPKRPTSIRPSAPVVKAPVKKTPPPAPVAPAPAPVVKAPAAEVHPDEPHILLQYQDTPIGVIVRKFSQECGRPLIGDYNVEGTITFFDSRPYTMDEAFDTINILLAMRSYRLIEDGRFLRLAPLDEVASLPLPIRQGLDDTDDLRDEQLITVLLPLKYISPDEASKMVVRMVSTFGNIAPLAKSKGVLITDRWANIQRINRLLKMVDTVETTEESQIKIIELKKARARDVAQVIDNLWGLKAAPKKMKYDERRKRNIPLPPDAKDVVRTTYDERTNMLMLSGEAGKLSLAEAMALKLDEFEGPAAGDVRVFDLHSAKATDLAVTLKQAMGAQTVRGRRTPATVDEVSIVGDAATNRLIVTAPVDKMARIEKLIEALDDDQADSSGVRVFRLKVADAQQMSQIISAATRKRSTQGRRSTMVSTLTVSADARTNTLIVAGDAGDINTAAKLIEELDTESPSESTEVRVIHLESGDVRSLAQSLTRVLNENAQPAYSRGRRTPTPAGKIRIEADRAGNSLIIAAPASEWPRIDKVLVELQAATSPNEAVTRLIPLKTATAAEMAKTLQQVYNVRNRSRRNQPGAAQVVIAASERANALLVTAGTDDQERIGELIAQMDVESAEKVEPIVMFELTSADAAKVASTLQSMLPSVRRGQTQKVTISADTLTNAVLVRAPAAERKMIEEMIARLDKATTARETRILPLKNASATAMVPMIQQLYAGAQATSSRRNWRRPQPAADDQDRVVVTAAPGDKALVVDAPSKKIDQIAQLVTSLDAEGDLVGRLLPRSYTLANADASELARSLGRLFDERRSRGRNTAQPSAEPQPRFDAERRSNTLLVAATVEQYEIIESLIQKMEADAEAKGVRVKMFTLRCAKAATIRQTVLDVLTSTAGSGGRGRGNSQITVSPDERTNVLTVSAPGELMATAEQVVAALDTPEAADKAVTTKVVHLVNSDATELAAALNAAMAGSAGSTPARNRWSRRRPTPTANLEGRKITVVANAGGRSLLLTGSAEDIAFAETIIAELDSRTNAATPVVKTYSLEHGDAEKIAKVLNDTVVRGQTRGGRGSITVPIRVSADVEANTIVVSAAADVQETIAATLEHLDTAEAVARKSTVEIVPLTNAKAEELAEALNAAGGVDPRRGGRGGRGGASVSAVAGGNALLLTGRPDEIAERKVLIAELDAASAKLTRSTKIFPLRHAKAEDLVEVVQTMLTGTASTSSQNRWSRNRRRQPAASSDEARVAAQAQTNSLIVQASPEKLALAEEMIKQFDVADAGRQTVIEIVQLANAQAASLAEAVNESLAAQRSTGSRGGRWRNAAASADDDVVTVTAEPNSNSVLVRGPADEVPAVLEMIRRLDGTGVSNIPIMRTYRLENNDAAEMAESLGQLFRDMIKQSPAPSSSRGRAKAAPTPFSITADERTNSLVVSTTEAYFTMFEQLLNKLEKTEVVEREVHYVQLVNADAYDLSNQLADMFIDRKGPDAPIIESDLYSNSLTIIAKELDFKRMEPIIQNIDRVPTVEVRVVAVSKLRADTLAEQLKRVYPQISDNELRVVEELPARGGPGQMVTPADGRPEILKADDTHVQNLPAADAGPIKAPVLIAVDKYTNSLIISGSRQDLDGVEDLIGQLSTGAENAEAEFRWFKIEQADPESVAATLTQLFNPPKVAVARNRAKNTKANANGDGKDKGKKPATPQPTQTALSAPPVITVAVDVRTRHVIVRAKPADFELIERIIKQLDQVTTVVTEVRTFPLKNTDAEEIAANLQELFSLSASAGKTSGSRLPNMARAAMVKRVLEFRGADGRAVQVDAGSIVGVAANKTTNSVVVSAPADAMEIIAGIIQELDQSAGESTKPVVRLYPAGDSDVSALAATLQQIFTQTSAGRTARGGRRGSAASGETPIIITADEAGRVLIVSASADKHELIAATIKDVQAAQITAGAMVVKVYKLEHAAATGVASAVQGAMASGGSAAGSRGRRGRNAATSSGSLRVTADDTSQSVVVSATPAQHERIAEIVRQMDTPAGGEMAVRSIALTHGDAAETAELLKRVFAGQARSGRRGSTVSTVVIEGDRESRMIMVRSDEETFTRIEAMARQMDAAGEEGGSGVFILPLTRAKAAQMAATVTDLYNQQVKAARQAKTTVDPMAVTADERANALILACTAEQFKKVSQWVNQVEEMNPSRGLPRMIQLDHADPAEVEKAIRQLFGGSAPPRGGTAADSLPFELTVLPTQRQLLIDASDEDYKTVMDLVKALDEAAKAERPEISLFELSHAKNTEVAKALTQIFSKIARKGRVEDEVTVTALPKTNAVMVAGTAEKLADASRLIKQLDTETISPKMEFRVYPLEHAQPSKVIGLLDKLLAEYRKSNPDEPIALTADEPTRSIVVTAQGPSFAQVEKILEAIDIQPATATTEVRVIPLVKADAHTLAEVLNEMLRPSKEGQVTPEARALQEQVRRLRVSDADGKALPELDLNKPIKISSDPSASGDGSNSLIISSTAENIEALTAIVKMMDTVPIAEAVDVKLINLKHADAESVLAVLTEIFETGAKDLAGKPGGPVAGKAEPTSPEGKGLVKPLNASADPRTNSLILSGAAETLALAERVVADLDVEAGGFATEVKLFRLRFADATKLEPVLQAVFAEDDSSGAAEIEGVRTHVTRLVRTLKNGKALESRFAKSRSALTIQADEMTNTLVVAARKEMMPLIGDVIASMDIPGAGSMNGVRIFPLTQADATRLGEVITGLYTGPNAKLIRVEDQPTVQVDTRTNSLIIASSEKTFAMVATLLKTLDAKVPVELRDIRLIPLVNADAAALADTIQKMMDARVQRLESLGAKDSESLRVVVVADDRSNSLIVGGSPEGYELVKDLAGKLDGASPALSGQIQVIPLTHANAGTLSSTLADLFDKRYQAARTADVERQKPVILPDLRTNCLLVAANQDDSKVLATLLAKLDAKPTDPAVKLVVIPLKFNDAGVVGPMIQDLFAARLKSMTAPGQEAAPQDNVDVATDPLANALVISASSENLEMIRGLLAKVDVDPPAETGIVRMYPLLNSDAERIAGLLEGLIDDGLYKPGLAAAGDNSVLAAREKVSIVADTRTNVLVVSASRENFAVIEEIIGRLDSADAYGLMGDIRVYTLKRADAATLAPTLKDFFDSKRSAEESAGGDGRSLEVTIVPDARTNTLLVAGSRESFNAIEAMIAKLDADADAPGDKPRVFKLAKADAAEVVTMVTELYASRGGLEAAGLSLTADERTNSVLVSGGAADLARIGELINSVDSQNVTHVKEIRVFPLRRADATEMADLLTEVLTSQPKSPTSENANRQALLQFIRKVPGGQAIISRALQEGLLISPDVRSNALVVAAPADAIGLLSNLIDALDNVEAPAAQIRMFSLENSDARQMATVLKELFRLENASPDAKAASYTLRSPGADTSGAKVTMGTAAESALTVTVDGRTNTLLVGGTPHYVDMAAEIIERLDSAPGQQRVPVVYHLRNAKGTDIEDAVRTWLDEEHQRLTDALGEDAGAGLQLLEREVSVVAVTTSSEIGDEAETSNTLLISASPRYIDTVIEMIAQLDEPQPQVHISVILAEVTLDDGLDLGVDWDIGRDLELGVTVAPENTTVRGSTFLGTASNFGAAGTGLNLSVTGGDLAFFLQALASTGKLEVVARPNIMAIDNQQAEINIGDRVPFVTNTSYDINGLPYNSVDYEDVGVNLAVTPRISPDGFVLMEVLPEISSLTSSSIQLSSGVSSPVFSSRKAKTIVSVRDGHTIIIGGLITTQEDEREDKIPFLGDIPILGRAFKRTVKDKKRTEFLIILTPRIVRNSVDAGMVTRRELNAAHHLKDNKMLPFDATVVPAGGGEAPKAKANQGASTGAVQVGPRRIERSERGGPAVTVIGGTK